MNHAARIAAYKQIEVERETRIVALVTSERVGLETQIARDAVAPFVSVLDEIGPTKKLSLIIDTNGGQTSAAWRLINLIRSFCDELEVIVPTKAMSAGTLMALGADKIVMTKQGALGPIDPSLPNHPLAPDFVTATGQKVRVSISAEAIRGYMEEVKKDVTDVRALAEVWNQLSAKIHPVILGDIFRLGTQIRTMATQLINGQVKDANKQAEIIQLLCSDSGSHDYTINRRKAAEIGLNVEKPSADLYRLLSQINNSYETELETFKPFSNQGLLGTGQQQAAYTLVRGLVESTNQCFGYVTEGNVVRNTTTALVERDVIFEGWRKIP
jgi:hypothetical protein